MTGDTRPYQPGPGTVVLLGVGNILLTDEGVGPTTVDYMRERWDFPDYVELVDGATAGLELINVFKRCDHLVVIDTVTGGSPPGSLYRFHPDDVPAQVKYRTSLHQVSFMDAWNMARLLGPVPDITILGVEPEDMTTPHVGLTATLQAGLPEIEALVLEELESLGVKPERRLLP